MKLIIFKKVLGLVALIILIFIGYFFIGSASTSSRIIWGVNFSQRYAQNLGLNWREVYLALLNDLGAKNLKIAVDWDMVEPEEGKYNFSDLDWQINQAEKKKAKLLLAVGMKTPRWPECHEPNWIQKKKPEVRRQKLLDYIKEVVNRYKNSSAVWAWQVENEPFFSFGECPKIDEGFLKKEIDLVRAFDPQKPIIISESGEFSLWFKAARYGDIVGVTMYKKVWFKEINRCVSYPFPPVFYQRKARIINKFFGKKVICVEFQAEPWGPRPLYDLPLEEQEKIMDLDQFQKNIRFAKKTGFDTFYLWGGEWWYWLKSKQNQPQIWNEAKKLF